MTALTWSRSIDGSNPDFKFGFNPVTAPSRNLGLKVAAVAAALKVANTARLLGKPIWLLSSGGVDSEIMCRCFLDAGVDFSVLTLDFNAYNEHDIRYAFTWCRQNGIKQNFHVLDIQKFLHEDYPNYVKSGMPTDLIFRALQVRMMEIVRSMGGYAVIGGGENARFIDFDRKNVHNVSLKDLYIEMRSDFVVPYEWGGRPDAEPYFYLSTPELVKAWFDAPINSFLINHQPEAFRHIMNRYTIKKLVYHTYWPDMVGRPKYDGLERVVDNAVRARSTVSPTVIDHVHTYRLPLTDVLAQLSGV